MIAMVGLEKFKIKQFNNLKKFNYVSEINARIVLINISNFY